VLAEPPLDQQLAVVIRKQLLHGPSAITGVGSATTAISRKYSSGSAALTGDAHDTNPASRREAANSAARSGVSSLASSRSRSSQRLSWSHCHSLLATAEGE